MMSTMLGAFDRPISILHLEDDPDCRKPFRLFVEDATSDHGFVPLILFIGRRENTLKALSCFSSDPHRVKLLEMETVEQAELALKMHQFRLVLTDVHLPDGKGYRVARLTRPECKLQLPGVTTFISSGTVTPSEPIPDGVTLLPKQDAHFQAWHWLSSALASG